MVLIHEFSTGIRVEKYKDCGWISRGFTGHYMNSTLPNIPTNVQRAIVNKEFAVAEGAYANKPAVVARHVQPSSGQESAWSVVAVVSRGSDEFQRPFSIYRYFLCEGKGKIPTILSWFKSLEKIPVFSPFKDVQPIFFDSSDIYEIKRNLTSLSSLDEKNNLPLVITPEKTYLDVFDALFSIHQNTQKITNKGTTQFAWAFNVIALEKPHLFVIIRAANLEAGTLIKRSLKNVPKSSRSNISSEGEIKSAVKSLISSSQIKPNSIKTIIDALNNPQITEEFWQNILDSQGASKAFQNKIYSPQMIRLLTLGCLLLPNLVGKFLTWLNPRLDLRDKNLESKIALDFQKNIKKNIPRSDLLQINNHLDKGIEITFQHFINQEEEAFFQGIEWLLLSEGSLWGNRIVEILYKSSHDRGGKDGRNRIYASHSSSFLQVIQTRPSKSAVVFSKLGKKAKQIRNKNSEAYFKIAAYFYQLTEGHVPKMIFMNAFPQGGRREKVFGCDVYRKSNLIESLGRRIYLSPILWLGIPLFALIFTSIGVLLVGPWEFTNFLSEDKTSLSGRSNSPTSSAPSYSGPNLRSKPQSSYLENQANLENSSSNDDISLQFGLEDDLEKRRKEFQKTQNSLKEIFHYFQSQDLAEEIFGKNIFEEKVAKILNEDRLDFSFLSEENVDDSGIEKWAKAIYRYQDSAKSESNIIAPDGFISPKGKTYEHLKKELEKQILPPPG